MSEISLNVAPPPDLLRAALTQGASPATGTSATAREGPERAAPGEASSAGNPFAALLSGVLQGSQPPGPSATRSGPDSTPLPDFEAQPADSSDVLALLALPGTATPLPAAPGETAQPGGQSGNTLPASGSLLPAEPSHQAESPTDLSTGPATPDQKRPVIPLPDLALSRALEPGPGSPATTDRATAEPRAVLLAGRFQALREPNDGQPEGAAESSAPPTLSPSLTGNLAPAPAAWGNRPLALRLTAADFLGDAATAGTVPDFLPGQLTSFASSSDGSSASSASALLAGTGPPDTGSAALLSRPGSTTLPALQPLGDASSFAGGLADRLLTLGGPGTHSARLQLHPEHLGELHVEIQIDDGSAQVWFGTATSQARDAIQASLPHLRELFADQGIQITRTQVDSGSTQMNHSASHQQGRMAGGAPDLPEMRWRPAAVTGTGALGGLPPAPRVSTRLVDVWA